MSERETQKPPVHGALQRRRRQQKRRRMRIAIAACALIALALAIGLLAGRLLGAGKRERLAGLWAIDAVTQYEFGEDGRGALVLPGDRYAFAYRHADDQLTIDFDAAGLADAQYACALRGNALTLCAQTGATYVLRRVQ